MQGRISLQHLCHIDVGFIWLHDLKRITTEVFFPAPSVPDNSPFHLEHCSLPTCFNLISPLSLCFLVLSVSLLAHTDFSLSINLTWMFWVGSCMLVWVLVSGSIICYHNFSQPRHASRLLARTPPFPPPHTPPLGTLIHRAPLNCHWYADDTELYLNKLSQTTPPNTSAPPKPHTWLQTSATTPITIRKDQYK